MKARIKSTGLYRFFQRIRWSIKARLLPYDKAYARTKNGEFFLNTKSWQTAPLPCQYGKTYLCYEEEESKQFEELIEKGDMVFDIGAQVGYYTLLAVKTGAGRVYALDIMNTYVREAKRQVALNGFESKVEVLRVALGKKDGEPLTFQNYFSKTKMKSVTLDTFCKEKNIVPNVIKIDVQGNELAVLEGAKEILKTHKPKIIVMLYDELLKERNQTKEEGIALLENAGYAVKLFAEDHAYLALPKS